MTRVLVTGGAGFIGSHTVDFFLEQGIKVTVYDNLTCGKLAYLNVFHPNLRIVQADVLDIALLQKEVDASDIILHLAALPSVKESIQNPIMTHKINSLGFLHMLQALKESKTKKRLVYASSAAVYGACQDAACSDEKTLTALPLSPYALEKITNEQYAALFATLYDIPSLGLRYFNVYGPRQDPQSPYAGVISKFFACFKENKPVPIYGNGEQSRDFIHVKDVAYANWLAITNAATGVMNIATGVSETLNALVQYLETMTEKKIERIYMPQQSGDIMHSKADIHKAKRILDFSATTSLSAGIKSLLPLS